MTISSGLKAFKILLGLLLAGWWGGFAPVVSSRIDIGSSVVALRSISETDTAVVVLPPRNHGELQRAKQLQLIWLSASGPGRNSSPGPLYQLGGIVLLPIIRSNHRLRIFICSLQLEGG